ncbi:hypothetical protein PG996_003208 [Apiospora saccharicola]|uniref:Uncharacterized protein n=1 Tax=Apiospora saccharicola TaxID=335842 RepID=A0ABR1W0M8_9PEZI
MAYSACVSIDDRLVQLARAVARKHRSCANRPRALSTVMRDIYQVCLPPALPIADVAPWTVRNCADVAIA